MVWNIFLHEFYMTFHSVGNGIIIPSDVHSMIFQRGRAQPPTRLRPRVLWDILMDLWLKSICLKIIDWRVTIGGAFHKWIYFTITQLYTGRSRSQVDYMVISPHIPMIFKWNPLHYIARTIGKIRCARRMQCSNGQSELRPRPGQIGSDTHCTMACESS